VTEAYKFGQRIYTMFGGILTTVNCGVTGGHNLKLCKLSCRSRIW